ncbi:PepSY domain-containing protein [Bacillus sp. FJAT-50079]|uniref:PepSY domain-containing protein n=1 Tax=Bacillus sp. FJAT-50079 TaxID=2833577 RepID=UPI001BC95B1F|nr:PepSY domain-containing protein [Bacillus sp. FJAT-50079]MBS4208457.1 PepSY domain-containing protein [Bacillus sp. FJAT-50079]
MDKINKRRATIAGLLFILLAIIVWQVWSFSTSAEPLSKEDAKRIAQEKYDGNVLEVNVVNDVYSVILKLDTGTYDLRIDRSSGDVMEIIRIMSEEGTHELSVNDIKEKISQKMNGKIEKLVKNGDAYDAIVDNDGKKTSITVNSQTGEVLSIKDQEQEDANQSEKKLTEAEAIKIALATVQGKVDDVDLEESNGLYYYLVEIELEDDDDREATVHINAITGEVVTITWDD